VVGFLPVHFKHGNRREEISNCCWFIFADVISRFEEIRRTPFLSLVFPTLGFFQGRFDQKFIVSLNVCLLIYFLSFKTAIEKIIYFMCFSQNFISKFNAY
jgi:hypothetical protein